MENSSIHLLAKLATLTGKSRYFVPKVTLSNEITCELVGKGAGMGILQRILGSPDAILPSDRGFGWRTSGLGTKYLLISCADGQPNCNVYGTGRDSLSKLVAAIDEALHEDRECLLLGAESMEVSCTFYQLDLAEAAQRLRL